MPRRPQHQQGRARRRCRLVDSCCVTVCGTSTVAVDKEDTDRFSVRLTIVERYDGRPVMADESPSTVHVHQCDEAAIRSRQWKRISGRASHRCQSTVESAGPAVRSTISPSLATRLHDCYARSYTLLGYAGGCEPWEGETLQSYC